MGNFWSIPWYEMSPALARAMGIPEKQYEEHVSRCKAAMYQDRANAELEAAQRCKETREKVEPAEPGVTPEYRTVTVRELALKSAELSEEIDGDNTTDIADTVRRHWLRGALHFQLPVLGFTEDPEDEDNARECMGVTLQPMPEAINTALRDYFGGDFRRPGPHDFNPEVVWEEQRWTLIDLLPEATVDGDGHDYDHIAWAIFIPADAIKR